MSEPKLQFMHGTSTGSKYLIIARRGSIALGIRPYPIVDGYKMEFPGKTYLYVRVHSRKIGKDAQDDSETNDQVVSLADAKVGLDEAWPRFTFEKVKETYAATNVGLFIRGSKQSDPMALLHRLKDTEDDVFRSIAIFLLEGIGKNHRLITENQLAGVLRSHYQGAIQRLEVEAKASSEFSSHIETHLDQVGFQGVMLGKMYEKYAKELHADDESENDETPTDDTSTEAGDGSG